MLPFCLAIGRQSFCDLVESLFEFVLAHLLSPIIVPDDNRVGTLDDSR